MGEQAAQAPMQAIKGYMIAVRELIEEPENAVHIDLLGDCQFASCAISGQ